MSDKEFSLARPMHEKKFNFLRLIDVKNTAILSALLLIWTTTFILLIWHVFLPHNNAKNTVENTAYNVIYVTNETSKLAEERWQREGGPSPEDMWRQEQEAKRREEERRRIVLVHQLCDIFPAPAAFSSPAVHSSHNRHEIDRTIAKQNTADREQLEGVFDWEDEKVDISIKRGIENIINQYAIESDTFKTCLFRMVKLYHLADRTIGFTGIWLVLSFGGLVICELIRWSFLGFFHYIANHLV
jgi:hypothetical protein